MHLRVRSRRPCRRESGRWGTLKGKEAHGRIGRFPIGNVRGTSRTRRRSKALESGTPPEVGGRRRPQGLRSRSWETIREGRGTRVQRRSNPTQVGGDGSPGDGSAFLLNGTPGRSGLRSRGTTPIRRKQATSDRSLGAKELRVYPEQPPRWPESRGKALETWLRPGRGVVVVTWGSTSVDRSFTTMDRALRSTRRHRARCHPPPRRVGTTRAGPLRWLGLLRAVARRGREARVLRNDGQGIAPTLCASQRVAVIACTRAFVWTSDRPRGGERSRAAEAIGSPPVLGRGCFGSCGTGPEPGWVGSSRADQREDDCGSNPRGTLELDDCQPEPPEEGSRFGGRSPEVGKGRSQRGVGRVSTTGGQRPR